MVLRTLSSASYRTNRGLVWKQSEWLKSDGCHSSFPDFQERIMRGAGFLRVIDGPNLA
jgi:hypothetical protein